jgi:hypothetical protein
MRDETEQSRAVDERERGSGGGRVIFLSFLTLSLRQLSAATAAKKRELLLALPRREEH